MFTFFFSSWNKYITFFSSQPINFPLERAIFVFGSRRASSTFLCFACLPSPTACCCIQLVVGRQAYINHDYRTVYYATLASTASHGYPAACSVSREGSAHRFPNAISTDWQLIKGGIICPK
eukprot:Trichotokara_eunicae@DN7635_c0_g1_i1.p1